MGHRYLVALLVCCAVLFSINAYHAYHVQYIGPTDSAQYAELGKSIAEGHGFSVNTVKFFFERYPSVTHIDDIYDPLQPLLLGALFMIFGVSVFVANLPSIIWAFIVTPVFMFLLARRYLDERLSFVVGIMALMNPLHQALYAWADPMFASLTIIGVYFFAKAQDNARWYLLSGAVFGLAALARKNGQIYFLFFAIAMIWLWLNRQRVEAAYAFGGMALFWLVMLPWFIRNLILFGTLTHTHYDVAKYLIGYYTSTGYHLWTARVFWHETIDLSWLVSQIGWTGIARKLLNEYARGFLTLLPLHIVGIITWRRLRFDLKTAFIIYFLSLIIVATVGVYVPRYSTPFIPLFFLAAIILWNGWMRETMTPWVKNMLRVALIAAVVFLLFVTVARFFGSVDYKNGSIDTSGPGFPRVDEPELLTRLDVAAWVDKNLPQDAIIMTQRPHDLNFYTDRRALKIPIDTADRIKEVICHYNVTQIEYFQDTVFKDPILAGSMKELLTDAALPVIYEGSSTIYDIPESYCAGSPSGNSPSMNVLNQSSTVINE